MKKVNIPVGINALRNDAESAIAIATAIGADFIRVNVHMNAVVSEQGIIQGASHRTLRLRSALKSEALIFADVGVKHAAPLADRGLTAETRDLTERGLADAIIVSGEMTGEEAKPSDVDIVRKHTHLPILIGSGVTPENIHRVYDRADGFIIGSYFKKDGKGNNFVEGRRVKRFMEKIQAPKPIRQLLNAEGGKDHEIKSIFHLCLAVVLLRDLVSQGVIPRWTPWAWLRRSLSKWSIRRRTSLI